MKRICLIFIAMLLLISCAKVRADQYTKSFYSHVNIMRESRDLFPLEIDRNVEKVAETYSSILAENGKIDHKALTPFEFNSLCKHYNIQTSTLLEVLASCPDYYVSYQVFLLFIGSDSHKKALLDPRGRFIGAGYYKKNGNIFFTAYIMIEKE